MAIGGQKRDDVALDPSLIQESALPFRYGSDKHKQLVEHWVGRLDDAYLSEIRKLPGLNDNEVFIWHVANQWLQATKSTHEQREAVHQTQLVFIQYSVGRLLNFLTDAEWDEWQTEMLEELRVLRTFNGSFLGLLYERGVLDGPTADFYNTLAWYHALVESALRTASRLLKPREKADVEIEMELMSTAGTLFGNKRDFEQRFAVNEQCLALLETGISLVRAYDDTTSWEAYFEGRGAALVAAMRPNTFNVLGRFADG